MSLDDRSNALRSLLRSQRPQPSFSAEQADPCAFPEVVALGARLVAQPDLPFFQRFDGVAGARLRADGQELVNFGSYNYLDLAGHPSIAAAVADAVRRYGTSSGASRIVAGERPVHQELEQGLARRLGAEAAMVFVGGHATNVTTIGHLMGPDDLIVHDALIHNSVIEGAKLSGARRLSFPHDDLGALQRMLQRHRSDHRRVLIVVEGVYSMDGDAPNLPALVRLKKQYGALLMIDEAHSLGVLGPTGGGLGEHHGVDASEVDLWMGTLSKTLCSCGGYLAGREPLITWLKYTVPGFLFSVGMSPPDAAAALAALRLWEAEAERVGRLQRNAARLVARLRGHGLDVGGAGPSAVVPVILGDSARALRWSQDLLARGYCVPPLMYPAVEEDRARLRLFVSAGHSDADLDGVADAIATLIAR
jgi:8-amino-7-oxononanoate synthase